MQLNTILGVIVVLAVVGGAAWYLSSTPPAPVAPSEETTENDGQGTLAELMARSGSWTCEVTSEVEGAPAHGTTYIDDGRIRADFTATVQGREVETHMIHADGYAYTWSDMASQGMKIAVGAGTATGAAATAVATDARVTYSCSPWNTDETQFNLPEGITFMELPQMPSLPDLRPQVQ